jgi:L-alanine-DL-glutamate epimerase-like enolase superfamily enzyme
MIHDTIRSAKVELWRYKLEKPVGGSGVTSVDVVVVDVEDAHGQTGIGFSYVLSGPGEGAARAARRIVDAYVINLPFRHPEALHRLVRSSFGRTGKGPLYLGLAAVDLAVWDLYSKRVGVPLGVAMGGASRPVSVYGSGGFTAGQDPEEAIAQALSYAHRGATAVKLRVDGSAFDRRLIELVCEAMEGRSFVAVDANEKCTLASAGWLANLAREYGLLFVEEPLAARDFVGYRSLTRSVGMSIATGEHLQGLDEAAPFVSDGLCHIIQPDLAMMGGMTECLRVTRLAEALGVEVAPHFLPNLFAHLAAVSPSVTWLEEFPLLEPLFANIKTFDVAGKLVPSDLLGHGLTWAAGARETFNVKGA